MQYDGYLNNCKLLFPVGQADGDTRMVIFYEPMITFFLAHIACSSSRSGDPTMHLADWGEPLSIDEVRELARAHGARRFYDISKDNWHLLIRNPSNQRSLQADE